MIKYTANYSKTNNNFVIQNIYGTNEKNKYYPVICILKNILQRGCPTRYSKYIESIYGPQNFEDFHQQYLTYKNYSKWINTIKGDEKNNYYPARTFIEEIIPEYFTEYPYLQQLFLPEVKFTDITDKYDEKFYNQQVDFYLPQAKLVIEIDGQQHKTDDVNRLNDKERDAYLKEYNILTIRIDTKSLEKKDELFEQKIEAIRNRISENKDIFNIYTDCYNNVDIKQLKLTAVIRFQMTILTMLEANIISLDDKVWNLDIKELDVTDFEEPAIEDLFIWFENLCQLNKVEFKRPDLNITKGDYIFDNNVVNIDFSVFNRYTDENEQHKNVIYVRTDYFDDKNYFVMSVSDPINYKIIRGQYSPDIKSLEYLLQNIFAHENFRDGQLPIIINALAGRDTIGLLPTGAGKSLCYQLCALLQPCISFVVCPIKALMYDQVENLQAINIDKINCITSDQKAIEKQKIMYDFGMGKYIFVLISPERFQTKDFRNNLKELNTNKTIALAVIDEVHCLSEWGHDFRTSYLTLIKTIRNFCPTAKLLGLTATASQAVIKDLKAEFNIENIDVKVPSDYKREELHYRLIKDNGASDELKSKNLKKIINKKLNEKSNEDLDSSIIFAPYTNKYFGVYGLFQEIKKEFPIIKSGWYSGSCPKDAGKKIKDNFDEYKKEIQRKFKNNEIKLLIATKAFGMGIDKSNIRFTIHYGMPSSMEQLYQESGRAGRDRNAAECYVLFSPEIMPQKSLQAIYERDTKIELINDIISKQKNDNARDVSRNLFLWCQNNKGIEFENEITKCVLKNMDVNNKTKLLSHAEIDPLFRNVIIKYLKEQKGLSFEFKSETELDLTQKALYRLSLLGIVDDWTIDQWGKNWIIEVTYNSFDESVVKEHLYKYIRKYDVKFDLSDENLHDDIYGKYTQIYKENNLDEISRLILVLLNWIYDNIIYQRRQAMKTLYDLCTINYVNDDQFKIDLESYFKFTEVTDVLDFIAEHPDEYSRWFDVFYEKNKFIDHEKLVDLYNNVTRFLETYRYNMGLDIISVITKLLLDRVFESSDSERLQDFLKNIKEYEPQKLNSILNNIYKAGKKMSLKNKNILSKHLYNAFSEKVEKTYYQLNDTYSLHIILNVASQRLAEINRRISNE